MELGRNVKCDIGVCAGSPTLKSISANARRARHPRVGRALTATTAAEFYANMHDSDLNRCYIM